MIYNNILEMIGNTPCIKYNDSIYLKLENYNPTGSVKDRAAIGMINDAEESGILSKGMVIVEATSGNTGISLAMIGKVKGFVVKLVMPDTMSSERISIMKAYGAEIILTKGSEGMEGAIKKANEMLREGNCFMPSQFTNLANPNYHYQTTGPEIIRDFPDIDAFVAGIGTGGTITGVGKKLKEFNPQIKIIGIEPKESAVLSGYSKGAHKIQGIGAGFKPDILDLDLIDEVEMIDYEEAKVAYSMILEKTGLLVGISAAAAVACALKVQNKHPNLNKIVVVIPDDGMKYLSTGFVSDAHE
ncbi:MAG: cysteine synthase A [Alkaliphilus sp.]|nr:cysteine synthase A [Alkaliphilus sp. AH-315-G20]PHS34231.1 MAG: cysteine synthase A [Alkaliphilus sp.]